MRIFLILVIALSLTIASKNVIAQQIDPTHVGSVKGMVRDTAHNYVLRSATASVYKAADSTLLSYQITNNYGEFAFKNLPVNMLLKIEISYVGYRLTRKTFTIPSDKNSIDLKTLIAEPRDETLKDVVISVPPISMNGDTLEFNAAAFKLDSNAVVEDLLRKIPNITLWGDGQITVNGAEVKSLLVNGKPFFGGDFKVATQNIAKNALQKIQVYNTVKDKSNPLDSTLEVNLKLKKGKDIGFFGKIGGGYGTDKRFESDASINMFSPKMQLAIVGASNNINKTAGNIETLVSNSTFKGTGTNVEYQPDFRATGLNQPNSAGAKFTYNFIEKPTYDRKNTLNSNYFWQNKNSDALSESQTITTLNSTDKITDKGRSVSSNTSTDHKFDSNYELVNKHNSFKFWQSLNVNEGDNTDQTFRSAENAQNILTSTNNAFNRNNYKNSSFNFSGEYRKSQNYLKQKELIRDFRATYAVRVNEDENQRLNITEFKSFPNAGLDRKFNRKYDTRSNGLNQQIDFEFGRLKRLFFGRKDLWGIDFSIGNKLNLNTRKDNDRVQDLDTLTNNYQDNEYLNNRLETAIVDEAPELNFSKSFYKGLSNRYYKNLTLSFEPKQKFIFYNTSSERSFQNLKRSYSRFLPDARISYSDSQYGEYYRSYNLNFTTTLNIPTIDQLAPLIDSTNFYYLRQGNLNLREAVQKGISFSFNHYDQTTKNSLNYSLGISAGMIDNNIVDSVLIDEQNRRTAYAVNADGNKYLNGNGNIRKAFKFKNSEVQVSLRGELNTSKNPGYTNNVFSFSSNLNTNSNLHLDYTYKSLFALAIGQNYSTYRSKQEAFNTKYSGKNIRSTLSTSYNVTKKFTLNTNISLNSSSSVGNKDVNFTIWNASAILRFLKGNNAEFKFSALDLLRQNTSIINYGNANSFTVGTQNVLRQYFMTTFSYYPRQFGKKAKK